MKKAQGASKPVVPCARRRGQRPLVPRKGAPGYATIPDYTPEELMGLGHWIESDTLLRTEDELQREILDELRFKQMGS